MMEQLELLIKSFFNLILLILNPIISIPIIILICVHCYKVKKYKEETYYKITRVPYFSATHNIGRYGEYLTYKKLKEYEKQGAKFLFNIYVLGIPVAPLSISSLMLFFSSKIKYQLYCFSFK